MDMLFPSSGLKNFPEVDRATVAFGWVMLAVVTGARMWLFI
jgi:hypothetical protein